MNDKIIELSGHEEAMADLESVRKAVFGDAGDEPNCYSDYDRLCELSSSMSSAMTYFDNASPSKVTNEVVRGAIIELQGWMSWADKNGGVGFYPSTYAVIEVLETALKEQHND